MSDAVGAVPLQSQKGPYDDGFDDAECLAKYCEDSHFRWLRFGRLKQMREAGGTFMRCQELLKEEGAFATREEMLYCFRSMLPEDRRPPDAFGKAIALSHPWWSPGHPDPHGTQLGWLVDYIQATFPTCVAKGLVIVSVDYCCLPQKPRSVDEQICFEKALRYMYVTYTHDCTHVLRLDHDVPRGEEESNAPYDDRGWCLFERLAAAMKTDANVFSRSMSRAEQVSVAPRLPESFRLELKKRHFSSRETDEKNVGNLYANLFAARKEYIVCQQYIGLKGQEVEMLWCALPHFANLRELELVRCELGGAQDRLCDLLSDLGWAPHLSKLTLQACGVGGGRRIRSAARGRRPGLKLCLWGDPEDWRDPIAQVETFAEWDQGMRLGRFGVNQVPLPGDDPLLFFPGAGALDLNHSERAYHQLVHSGQVQAGPDEFFAGLAELAELDRQMQRLAGGPRR